MPKAQSKTRHHFEKNDGLKSKVRCKLCSVVLSTGGGTSNMLSHLKKKHTDTLGPSLADSSFSSVDGVVNININQDNSFITDFKKSDQKLAVTATDFQPFSTVHDKGFCNFVQSMAVRASEQKHMICPCVKTLQVMTKLRI